MLQTTGASAPFDANTQTETNTQTSQKPFPEKIKFLDALLHIQDNFDIIKREYTVGTHSIVIYYVAGLIVDQTLERIAGALLEMPATDEDFSDANRFSQKMITYGEVNITSDESKMLELLYTGCVVLVCDAFEPFVILTVRGYPQRNPEEPENDKVLRGPHISFVETLAKNTALLRRHIHDPRFIIKPFTVGNITQTKVTLGVIILALATNQTVEGRKRYFYPLIPFNGRALLRLFVRLPKSTTERTEQKGSGKEVQESANRKKESKNGMKRS